MDTTIKKILSEKSFPPILLLHGDEDLLVEEAAQQLYNAAAELDQTGMNCDVLDGESSSLDAVLSVARSFPIMSDKRVVWVRRADKLSVPRTKKAVEALTELVKNPSDTTFLLLTAALPSRSKSSSKKGGLKFPFDVVAAHHSVIDFPSLKESQVSTWLIQRAAAAGVKLDNESAALIVAQNGAGLRDNAMQLEKLLVYIGTRKTISIEDVHEVVGGSREYNIFELESAIGSGNAQQAMRITLMMLEGGTAPLAIVAMLTRYFMALFRLADLRTADPAEIARTVGVQPWKVRDYWTTIDALGIGFIERALHEVRQSDAALKSSAAHPTVVLQTLLSRVFGNRPSA